MMVSAMIHCPFDVLSMPSVCFTYIVLYTFCQGMEGCQQIAIKMSKYHHLWLLMMMVSAMIHCPVDVCTMPCIMRI